MASTTAGSEDWTTVRGRSQSLSAAEDDISRLSKSARKNARRKERKAFEKKWGVRPGSSEAETHYVFAATGTTSSAMAVAAGDDGGDTKRGRHQSLGEYPSHEDDEILHRALAASLRQQEMSTPDTDSDPRHKKLRNLKKKIAAAEALELQQHQGVSSSSDLDEAQRTKLARLPSLRQDAERLESQLTAERIQREEEERARREAELANHRQRIEEWSALSEGAAVRGFRAGADQDAFACPLCAGPLEAAFSCVPCSHVFCRACLEDALASAADRSGGDPASLNCPLCRSLLFDATSDKVLVEPALNVRKKMKKKKVECRCGVSVALSSLREHLRQCREAAPGLFSDDTKKRFGHEFQRPSLDPDLVAEMAGKRKKKKRNSNMGTSIRSPQEALARGLVPEGYDEEEALQIALQMSSVGLT